MNTIIIYYKYGIITIKTPSDDSVVSFCVNDGVVGAKDKSVQFFGKLLSLYSFFIIIIILNIILVRFFSGNSLKILLRSVCGQTFVFDENLRKYVQ